MNPPFYQEEMAALCELVRGIGCKSFLEIGSRHGYSLDRIARCLPAGSRIAAIDLPGHLWGTPKTADRLKQHAEALAADGYDAHLYLGNSQKPEAVAWAAALGPFDLIHIDADHTYEGVKSDWENYGPLGKIVVFHDIAAEMRAKAAAPGEVMAVPILWGEIKSGHLTVEINRNSGAGLGYGVIWR